MTEAAKRSDGQGTKANGCDSCCIMEIEGQAVGLLTMEGHGFVFYAAMAETWPLDRRVFSRRRDAERAVRDLYGKRQSSR